MTRRPHHDIEELAALYASGALPEEERAAFEQKLADGDPAYVEAWEEMQDVVSELLDVEPVEPPFGARQSVLAAAEASAGPDEVSVQVWRQWASDRRDDVLLIRGDESGWQDTGVEGVAVRRLFLDEEAQRMTALFRMDPGSAYPSHIHEGSEECLVLEGSIQVNGETLRRGDYQRQPAGSRHGVTTTEEGALLLITGSSTDLLD